MRDWRKVNDNLVKRGFILLDFSFLDRWDEELALTNKPKASVKGPKFKYPNALFYLAAFLNTLIGFRQVEGVLQGLSKLRKFRVPDYTTIFRRVRRLKLKLNASKLKDGFIVAIDSSGIKVTNRGEWLRKVGKKKRRGWIKMHVAVDVRKKRLLALRVTDEKQEDNSEFKNLLSRVLEAGKPSKVLADSAYDSRENFNLLASLGIVPGIKPRKVEIPKGLRKRKRLGVKARGSVVRKKSVIEYSLNPKEWKRKLEYGGRWVAEIFFSAFKRIFGEYVRARRFENMVNELMIKAMLYNLFISL